MKLNKREWGFVISFIVCIMLAVGVWGVTKTEAVSEKPIQIGATIPMTGPMANHGRLYKQAFDLALEDVNSTGGIKGRPLQVIIEDHRSQADVGIAVLRKLIDVDKVPLVLPTFTAISFAQKPIAEQSKIVFFTCAVVHPNFTKDSYWTFQNSLDNTAGENLIARAAFEKIGLRKVAYLYENTDIGRFSKSDFQSEFEKSGGKIVASIGFDTGLTDARPQIIQALAAKPDGVKVYGTGTERPIVYKQLREMGFKGIILGDMGTEQDETLRIAGVATEGIIYYHGVTDTNSPDPFARTFHERHLKKYGEYPETFGIQHYEGIRMIAEVLRRGAVTPEEIRKGLLGLKDFPGVSGALNFDPETRRVQRPLVLKTIKDGKFVLWEKR